MADQWEVQSEAPAPKAAAVGWEIADEKPAPTAASAQPDYTHPAGGNAPALPPHVGGDVVQPQSAVQALLPRPNATVARGIGKVEAETAEGEAAPGMTLLRRGAEVGQQLATGLQKVYSPTDAERRENQAGAPMSDAERSVARRQSMSGLSNVIAGGSTAAIATTAPELWELGSAAAGGDFAAKAAITKMVGAATAGDLASAGAGKVAEKYNLSPETTELIRTGAFFLPSLAGVMGFKGGFGEVAGNPAAAVEVPGGVRAGVVGTPDAFEARVKVGGTQYGVRIPRGQAAAPAPPDPARVFAAQEQQSATDTLVSAANVQKAASDMVAGKPPQPPPGTPKPPPTPAGMDDGQLTQQTVEHLASLVSAAPPAERAQMMLEAHGKLADWIHKTGTFVDPQGKVQVVENQAQAQKAASGIVNAEVDRQTAAAEAQQKQQEKAAADAQKAAQERQQEIAKPEVQENLKARTAAILEGTTPKPGQVAEQVIARQLQVDPATAQQLVEGYQKDRAAAAAPTVGSAAEPVAEESKATIDKQMEALKRGDTNVVMLPTGTRYKPALPEGMKAMEVTGKAPGAGTYLYAPDRIQPSTIRAAAKAGTHGDLLGHVQPKDEVAQAKQTVSVQAQDAKDGTPIQDSEVDAEKPELVRAQAEAMQERHPDAQVVVRPTHEVLTERANAVAKEHPEDAWEVANEVAAPKPDGEETAEKPEQAAAEPEKKPEAAATPSVKGDRVAFRDREGVEREGSVAYRGDRVTRLKGEDGKEYTVKPKDIVEPRPILEPGGVGRVATSSLHLDPKRFQYKVDVGAEGVNDLLKGKKWNDDLAGVVSAWRDPADGESYIVNGHHRAVLAKSTGAPSMAVRMLNVKTAEEARAVGALQNIAEGRGTALDAAKFLRDSGITLEHLEEKGISMGEATAQNGVALSRLDGRLFDQVVHGKMSPGRGIAIGKETGDAATQDAIVKMLDKAEKAGKRITDGTVAELARFANTAPQRNEQVASLFGTEEQTHSTALEKAEVSSYVKRTLSTEKRVFGAVSSEGKAKTLEATGNKINAAENSARATDAERAIEVYDRLSARRGPIDDILNRAAGELADARPSEQPAIKQRAYDDIRAAVSDALGGKQGEGSGGDEADADRPPNKAELEAAGQSGFFSRTSARPSVEEIAALERDLSSENQRFSELVEKMNSTSSDMQNKRIEATPQAYQRMTDMSRERRELQRTIKRLELRLANAKSLAKEPTQPSLFARALSPSALAKMPVEKAAYGAEFQTVPASGNDAPMFTANQFSRRVLAEASPALSQIGEWQGVALPRGAADQLIQRVRMLGESKTGQVAQTMKSMADALEGSRDPQGNVIILDTSAPWAKGEEQFHAWQLRNGDVLSPAVFEIGQNPAVAKASAYLQEHFGYDASPYTAAIEATAKAFNGDWRSAGLTQDEAAGLLREFLDSVARLSGQKELNLPAMQKRVADMIGVTQGGEDGGGRDQGIERQGVDQPAESGAGTPQEAGGGSTGSLRFGDDAGSEGTGNQQSDLFGGGPDAGSGGERNEVGQGQSSLFQRGDGSNPQTRTPEFKKWFGDSKVVDADGRPLVVYHGTASAFDTFSDERFGETSQAKELRGYFFSEYPTTAKGYARTAVNARDASADGPGHVIDAYVSLQNPKTFTDLESFRKAKTRDLQTEGYDGAIRLNDAGDKVEVVAFRSGQIKSATHNSGAFDPNNPSILASRSPVEVMKKASSLTKDYFADEAEKVATSRDLHAGLYDLGSQRSADQLRMVQLLKSIEYNAKDAEAIYHHLEDPALDLTDNQQHILDEYLTPLTYERDRMYREMTDGGTKVENYVRRFVKDRPSALDRIMATEPGAKPTTTGTGGSLLKKTTGSMKHRTMMALENAKTGERKTVAIKGGRVMEVAKGKAPVDRGGLANGLTTLGEHVDKQMAPYVEEVTRLRDELTQTKGQKAFEQAPRGTKVSRLEEKLKDAEAARDHFLNEYAPEDLQDTVWKDKQGQLHRITQATTKEIERDTDLKYHKDGVASTLLSYYETANAYRAWQFIEDYKADPTFKQVARSFKDAGAIPEGWRATQLPQMRGYYFEPHVAEVLDRYAATMQQSGKFAHAAEAVGNFLRTSIFFNPMIHIPNLANHWYVEKGLTGMANPMTYYRMFGEKGTATRALRAVMTQNQDFLDALDVGAPLQSQRYETQQFAQLILDHAREELTADESKLARVAKAIGMSPVNAVKAIYTFSGKATWYMNDLMFLQSAYEKMDRTPGMTLKQALRETGKHIPDYRMPSRIFDSHKIATLMQNPNLTMFGAYHYGALKSYGQVLKSIAGADFDGEGTNAAGEPVNEAGRTKTQERLHGLDVAAGIAFVMAAIYPALDALMRGLTGNQHAEVRRAGSSTFINNVVKVYRHEMTPTDFATSIATPAVHTKALAEMLFNRDLRTGQRIYSPTAHAGDLASQASRKVLESVAPVAQGLQLAQGQTDWKKMAWSMLGIGFPLHGAAKVGSQILAGQMADAPPQTLAEQRHSLMKSRALHEAWDGRRGEFDKLMASDEITPKEKSALRKRYLDGQLVDTLKKIHSYTDAVRMYQAGSEEERRVMRPTMSKKLATLRKKGKATSDDEEAIASPEGSPGEERAAN